MSDRTKKRRWQFLWWRDDDYPRGKVHQRVYVAPTIQAACDKMLRWMRARDFNVSIDEEARAEHVRYRQQFHERKYPNLSNLDHEISDYV